MKFSRPGMNGGNGHNKQASARAVELVRTAMLTGQPVLLEKQSDVPLLKAAMRQVGAPKLRVETRGAAPRSMWAKPTAASPYAPELLAYREAEEEARNLAYEARSSGLRSEDMDLGLSQDDFMSRIMGAAAEYAPVLQAARTLLAGTALGQKLSRYKIRTPANLVAAYNAGKLTADEYRRARAAMQKVAVVPAPIPAPAAPAVAPREPEKRRRGFFGFFK